MDNLKFELTIEQVQRLLNLLGEHPYISVSDIIDSVKKQANDQLNH